MFSTWVSGSKSVPNRELKVKIEEDLRIMGFHPINEL